MPDKFILDQNYPNPFNPTTRISFYVPQNSFVTLKIYDLLGTEISTLVNEDRVAGYHKIEFDATQLSSGIYFYKLSAGNFSDMKKMTVLK